MTVIAGETTSNKVFQCGGVFIVTEQLNLKARAVGACVLIQCHQLSSRVYGNSSLNAFGTFLMVTSLCDSRDICKVNYACGLSNF